MGEVWATAVETPGYREDPQPQTFVFLIAHVLPYGLRDEKPLLFQLTAAPRPSLEKKETWVNRLGRRNGIDSRFCIFETLLNVINLTEPAPFASVNQINVQKIHPSFVSQHAVTMCYQMNTFICDG